MLPEHIKWQINRLCNIHIQGNKRNIFIFSTARSGSTWLAEMIATQKSIKFIDEPFFLARLTSRFSPFPSSWRSLLPNNDREALVEEYFEKLIRNRCGVGIPAPFSKFHRFFSRRIVFKILRCKDMMNWFEERFNAQIVYLIRHPIAVAVSRERYGRLPLFLENELFCKRYLTPELRSYGLSIIEQGSSIQKKVLDWCLQNIPPLRFLNRERWFCLTFERLVSHPQETILALAGALELDEPNKLIARLGIPSRTVHLSDEDTRRYLEKSSGSEDRTPLLNRWRRKVSEEEEFQAFEMLKRFGIDLYQFGKDFPTCQL